jgi:hypothetical protein
LFVSILFLTTKLIQGYGKTSDRTAIFQAVERLSVTGKGMIGRRAALLEGDGVGEQAEVRGL